MWGSPDKNSEQEDRQRATISQLSNPQLTAFSPASSYDIRSVAGLHVPRVSGVRWGGGSPLL